MDNTEARERWFCELVDAGLSEQIFDSSALMDFATPEVLAANLPPDLMARVLQAALSAGKLTTDRMLETLTPSIVAHHIPHDVLWACAVASAKRAGISEGNGEAPKADKRRSFLRRVLAHGLDTAILTPDDILEHATPEVLAAQLPNDLKAKLLTEGLRSDKMNPTLIVDVLGVEELAANVHLSVLWACVADAGDRSLGGSVERAVAPKKEPASKAAASAAAKRATPTKPKKAGRAATAGRPSGFDDDTNVNEWASEDEFDVVEESELAAMTDQVIGDWGGDEETNVGIDPTRK